MIFFIHIGSLTIFRDTADILIKQNACIEKSLKRNSFKDTNFVVIGGIEVVIDTTPSKVRGDKVGVIKIIGFQCVLWGQTIWCTLASTDTNCAVVCGIVL